MQRDFHTPLGRTGLITSRIGIGSSYGITSKALQDAFERGLNFFYFGTLRTAEMARAVRQISVKNRSRLVVAIQSYSRWASVLARSVDIALRKLNLEYADLLILGKMDRPISPQLKDQLVKIKESGKIRFLVVSAHRRAAFSDHLQTGIFDVIMARYNAAHIRAETEVFPLLPAENRPGVICYTATRWGTLLRNIPGEQTVTAADCYRFVLRNPAVDVCLSGPKNAQELQDAFRALESPPMNDQEAAWMRRIGAAVYQQKHHNFLLRKLIFD